MPSLLGKIETVSVNDLKLYPGNPRVGNVGLIAESLAQNKQYAPLVVQRSTRYVLAGNHTLKAAMQLAWPTVDVVYVDVSNEQARKIVLSSNRTAELGSYDDNALMELLSELADDFAGTGWTPDDLDDLLSGAGAMPVLPESPTDASFGESEEDIQARLDRFRDAQPRQAFGVREAILILPQEEFEELHALIRTVREAAGGEQTAGDAVLKGMRAAARVISKCSGADSCAWCS